VTATNIDRNNQDGSGFLAYWYARYALDTGISVVRYVCEAFDYITDTRTWLIGSLDISRALSGYLKLQSMSLSSYRDGHQFTASPGSAV
jgi:hypothetical protein